jgi:hypothetical protein
MATSPSLLFAPRRWLRSLVAGELSSPRTPGELANAWLDSWVGANLELLTKQTHLPFALHDPEAERNCASSPVNDSASLAKLVNCIGEDTLLIKDLSLGETRSPTEEKHVDKGCPRWA